MTTLSEILKKVKRIEISNKKNSQNLVSGSYKSAFKGQGMSFSELRPYQYGDDVRRMDWNKTARLQSPYVKVMEEERELTILFMVDVSASIDYATKNLSKKEYVTEICASLGIAAAKNQDKVGLILFSNQIKKIIPPKKGKKQVLNLLQQLLSFDFEPSDCQLDACLKQVNVLFPKKTLLIVISDFKDAKLGKNLMIASKKHLVLGFKISDEKDEKMPDIGYACFRDAETGKMMWTNTSPRRWRYEYLEKQKESEMLLKQEFAKNNASLFCFDTADDYAKSLSQYFRK